MVLPNETILLALLNSGNFALLMAMLYVILKRTNTVKKELESHITYSLESLNRDITSIKNHTLVVEPERRKGYLTNKTKTDIIAMTNQGIKVKDICKTLKISPFTVWNVKNNYKGRKSRNKTRQRTVFEPEQKEEIRTMLAHNIRPTFIATKMKVKPQVIYTFKASERKAGRFPKVEKRQNEQ